jgi:hypothetical protein
VNSPNNDIPLVLGIGLPRSAGQTLQKAIKILTGKEVVHAPGRALPQLLRDPNIGGMVEVFAPVEYLIHKCPSAKLIYNDRKREDWWRSCSRVYHQSAAWNHPIWKHPFEQFPEYYNEYRDVRERYACAMRVGKKKSQFMWHDFTAEPTWERLCAFLGVDEPDEPFPNIDIVGR